MLPIDIKAIITRLDPGDFTSLLGMLLSAERIRLGMPANSLVLSDAIIVGDGGLDAVMTGVPANGPSPVNLRPGLVGFQAKATKKSGPSAFGLDAELKKPGPVRVLREGGTYVLACCQDLNPRQRTELEKAVLAAARKVARNRRIKSGYLTGVWDAQTLVGLCQQHAGAVADLGLSDFTGAYSLQEMLEGELKAAERPFRYDKNREEVVAHLRERALNSEDALIAVVQGFPGVGNTRTVVEALDIDELRDGVLYVGSTDGLNPMLVHMRRHPESGGILVVDEVGLHEGLTAAERLEGLQGRWRVVVVDGRTGTRHTPETETSRILRPLGREAMRELVVGRAVLQPPVADLVARAADGYPKLGFLLADALRDDPAIGLAELARLQRPDDILRRAIPEADTRRHLGPVAMFQVVGFDDDAAGQVDAVASVFGLDAAMLRHVCERELEAGRFVSARGRFRSVSPLIVAVWLAFETIEDTPGLAGKITALPEPLQDSFLAQVEYFGRRPTGRGSSSVPAVGGDRGGVQASPPAGARVDVPDPPLVPRVLAGSRRRTLPSRTERTRGPLRHVGEGLHRLLLGHPLRQHGPLRGAGGLARGAHRRRGDRGPPAPGPGGRGGHRTERVPGRRRLRRRRGAGGLATGPGRAWRRGHDRLAPRAEGPRQDCRRSTARHRPELGREPQARLQAVALVDDRGGAARPRVVDGRANPPRRGTRRRPPIRGLASGRPQGGGRRPPGLDARRRRIGSAGSGRRDSRLGAARRRGDVAGGSARSGLPRRRTCRRRGRAGAARRECDPAPRRPDEVQARGPRRREARLRTCRRGRDRRVLVDFAEVRDDRLEPILEAVESGRTSGAGLWRLRFGGRIRRLSEEVALRLVRAVASTGQLEAALGMLDLWLEVEGELPDAWLDFAMDLAVDVVRGPDSPMTDLYVQRLMNAKVLDASRVVAIWEARMSSRRGSDGAVDSTLTAESLRVALPEMRTRILGLIRQEALDDTLVNRYATRRLGLLSSLAASTSAEEVWGEISGWSDDELRCAVHHMNWTTEEPEELVRLLLVSNRFAMLEGDATSGFTDFTANAAGAISHVYAQQRDRAMRWRDLVPGTDAYRWADDLATGYGLSLEDLRRREQEFLI